MGYVCFTKHSQFSVNIVISMPHLSLALPCFVYHRCFLMLLFTCFNLEPFSFMRICSKPSFFFFPSPLWFSSAQGVGKVSVGAKQEFTGLCASSQRAVRISILLKVSDVRPNVCGGWHCNFFLPRAARGCRQGHANFIINTSPCYPSTCP